MDASTTPASVRPSVLSCCCFPDRQLPSSSSISASSSSLRLPEREGRTTYNVQPPLSASASNAAAAAARCSKEGGLELLSWLQLLLLSLSPGLGKHLFLSLPAWNIDLPEREEREQPSPASFSLSFCKATAAASKASLTERGGERGEGGSADAQNKKRSEEDM